jgi:hypothetical protein
MTKLRREIRGWPNLTHRPILSRRKQFSTLPETPLNKTLYLYENLSKQTFLQIAG